MLVKSVLVVCIQAFILQTAHSQCIGTPLTAGDVLLPSNMALEGVTPLFGRIIGANIIVDTSAPEPAGVSIFSEDILIEGTLLVTGKLPFLGTVALEGVIPTTGISAVTYECGTGDIGMTDTPPVTGVVPPNIPGFGVAGNINRLARL